MQQQYKRLEAGVMNKKNYEGLMCSPWADDNMSDSNQNQRLLSGNAALSDQNRKLRHAVAVGFEAETIAKDTKLGLQGDSERMDRMRDRVGRIQGEVSVSGRLLNSIEWNERKNSMLLYWVVWLLISWIIAIIFYKIIK